MFCFLRMYGLLELLPTSSEHFKSTAPLEIYLLGKMVTCSTLILPAVNDLDMAENPYVFYALYCTYITQRLDFLNSFLQISTLTLTWLWCYLMLTEWWHLFIESGWRSQAWYEKHTRWSDREIEPSACRPWLQMNHIFTMRWNSEDKMSPAPRSIPKYLSWVTNHPIIMANTRSQAILCSFFSSDSLPSLEHVRQILQSGAI